MAYIRKMLRLGDVLIQEGKITPEQLEQALAKQKEENIKLGEAIIMMGFTSQDEINDA